MAFECYYKWCRKSKLTQNNEDNENSIGFQQVMSDPCVLDRTDQPGNSSSTTNSHRRIPGSIKWCGYVEDSAYPTSILFNSRSLFFLTIFRLYLLSLDLITTASAPLRTSAVHYIFV
ncbi:uncharacterized protein ARMOST_19502 [Armillaria ostoyae]|uniref:Uncharacterized protein n=1 Tax=Armillaria ostoyae TaxID=47428 RepID=A0A284S4P9_ARMOS|nr:uncharacterized protein ARMOST_19502 [Armillaria ostoyae]